jgi:hypothetical protein
MNGVGGTSPHLWVISALKRVFVQNNYFEEMGSFRKNLCNSLIGKALYAKKDFGHKKYLKKVIKKVWIYQFFAIPLPSETQTTSFHQVL